MSFLADKRVLVVDDSSLILSAIKLMLLKKGAQSSNIILAKDAKTTINACQTRAFDFILFDYNLGQGADGLQLLAYLTMAQLIAKHCVIYIVTAEQTRQVVHGFSEWNPDGYLVKPFNINHILPRMVACYKKKQALIELEAHFLKTGMTAASNYLQRLHDKPYYIDYKIQLLTWDGQITAAKALLSTRMAEGDVTAVLSYANWLLAQNAPVDAFRLAQPLLSDNRLRLSALEVCAYSCLTQGKLQHAYDYLSQMNEISPANPQRLLIQFNLATILNNYEQMQQSVIRYQKATRHLSWLNIDCQFNLLRCLLVQLEALAKNTADAAFTRLERDYLQQRLLILQNPRAAHIQSILHVLDARLALCKNERQQAVQIIARYTEYERYIELPFYCQLDIVHLYRRLMRPLPSFIAQLAKPEQSQALLLQNSLRYTTMYQQQLNAQLRSIKTLDSKGLHMQAVHLCLNTVDKYGINISLAKALIRGFSKAIPLDIAPVKLKHYYQLAKHCLTTNTAQQNNELYFKYCRYIESTVAFLHTDIEVAV